MTDKPIPVPALTKTPLIDSHSHIEADDFDADRDAMIARMQAAKRRSLKHTLVSFLVLGGCTLSMKISPKPALSALLSIARAQVSLPLGKRA